MIGIYFSGTGNTAYAVKRFVKQVAENAESFSITDPRAIEEIEKNDLVVFGYPIYFSDTPKIVKDFIDDNKERWASKKIFIIATQGIASGDGAGCAARQFKKHEAKIVGGLHVKMSDSVSDAWVYRNQNHKAKCEKANGKIDKVAERFKNDKPTRHGLSTCGRVTGFCMQRLWFGRMTKTYRKKPKINHNDCVSCGVCVKECPLNNLELQDGRLVQKEKCTLCYRCVNLCPKKSLTILGRKVYKQHIQE